MLHGRKCATGCVSGRCSCKRKGKLCSEGCQCLNCTNITTVNKIETDIAELVVEENAVDSDVDDVMDWDGFGEGSTDTESELDVILYMHGLFHNGVHAFSCTSLHVHVRVHRI